MRPYWSNPDRELLGIHYVVALVPQMIHTDPNTSKNRQLNFRDNSESFPNEVVHVNVKSWGGTDQIRAEVF